MYGSYDFFCLSCKFCVFSVFFGFGDVNLFVMGCCFECWGCVDFGCGFCCLCLGGISFDGSGVFV